MTATGTVQNIQAQLPSELVTGHWYNDLQHSMFVILFRHLDEVLAKGDESRMTSYLMDMTSSYLYIHFLSEEEGMAFTLADSRHELDAIQAHAELHLRFLAVWRDTVYGPWANGELAGADLRAAVADYYDRVLKHIGHNDQHTYGTASESVEGHHRREIAHLASTGLPLSPYMAGTMQVLQALAPEMARRLSPRNLAPAASTRIGGLRLAPGAGRLLGGRALRDRVLAVLGSGGMVRAATLSAA